jgi:hypothetical protein
LLRPMNMRPMDLTSIPLFVNFPCCGRGPGRGPRCGSVFGGVV